MEVEDSSFFLIVNIPSHFHSSDLRAFFSHFVEKKGFSCFHYRHRPEHIKIFRDERPLKIGDQHPAGDQEPQSSESVSQSSSSRECTSETEERIARTNCCVVAVPMGTQEKEFMELYHTKNWAEPDGQLLPGRVRISKLRVIADTDEKGKESSAAIPWTELKSLPELNPPAVMPQGNVGTPLSVFMDLIRSCKLPAYVIKKLGLEFPKSRSKKRYGAVGLNYGTAVVEGSTDRHEMEYQRSRAKAKTQGQGPSPAVMDSESDTGSEEAEAVPSDDDRDAEEWERYEALHEDVDKQERSKERLFEDELEVVWDKGSSGLVFYTDASYWDQQEGDFDEKCSQEDDWDVDMSAYYGYAGSDKDARDLRDMEVERRRRQGKSTGVPAEFERYTKGIGSKLLKKTGWTVGSGVGSTSQGIVEPVETEGQHPHSKRGLGYHGEKLDRHAPSSKKQRVSRDVIISTVYDKPEEEQDTVLRRAPPRTIKYREIVKFLRGGVQKPDSSHKH